MEGRIAHTHTTVTLADDEETIRSTDLDTTFNVRPPPGSSNARLSKEIIEFLMARRASPQEILSHPIVAPPHTDDSLPVSHYFISASHNTYLLSYQLLGKADASAYTRVLSHTCRCVEIDVWTGSKGPIVTHGWTGSDHIPFRDVCVAIGNAVTPGDWPVMVSLECHVNISHQDEMVNIMREVWGGKLVDKEIDGFQGNKRAVTPKHLKGKIMLMATSQIRTADDSLEEDTALSDASASKIPRKERNIGPSLAALGVYGRSIKPHADWFKQLFEPFHVVFNLSEGAIGKLLPESLESLIQHSLTHLRRVYPQGTRVTSDNLSPLKHWRSGSQICALNWQRYDRGLQFNEAMFVGSGGWVCKPDRLRGLKFVDRTPHVRLTCEIIGGCNSEEIPKPTHDVKVYVYAELFIDSSKKTWRSQSRHPSSSLPTQAPTADLLWNEKFHWEYLEDNMAFIRLTMYQDEWGKDDRLGTFCARVDYLQQGWRFIRLFNKRGKHNGGLLLVRFTYV
ncbi:PLC-like phosphodiesterase [Hysterangium stoloniferum]|nr:PLC-like phosphodiesterase [Hysterangium stoloniferum]